MEGETAATSRLERDHEEFVLVGGYCKVLQWCELWFLLLGDREEWQSPRFAGSMLRGAFGHALKRLVCVMRRMTCTECPLQQGCLYVQLFETRPDPARQLMRKYERAPHPFCLITDFGHEDGGERAGARSRELRFAIRLFGEAVKAAPFVMSAVDNMAQEGLSKQRIPFRLAAVDVGNGWVKKEQNAVWPEPVLHKAVPQPAGSRVHWRLKTPLRLKANGKLVDVQTLGGGVLARAMLRRIGLMLGFFADESPELDFAALREQAEHVRLLRADTRWNRLQRYSSRQGGLHAISGLTGEVELDFSHAPALAQLASLVPVVHLGKGTSMGLGRIEQCG